MAVSHSKRVWYIDCGTSLQRLQKSWLKKLRCNCCQIVVLMRFEARKLSCRHFHTSSHQTCSAPFWWWALSPGNGGQNGFSLGPLLDASDALSRWEGICYIRLSDFCLLAISINVNHVLCHYVCSMRYSCVHFRFNKRQEMHKECRPLVACLNAVHFVPYFVGFTFYQMTLFT